MRGSPCGGNFIIQTLHPGVDRLLLRHLASEHTAQLAVRLGDCPRLSGFSEDADQSHQGCFAASDLEGAQGTRDGKPSARQQPIPAPAKVIYAKKSKSRIFLVIHWLRLCASNAWGFSLIPGPITSILHVAWPKKKREKRGKKANPLKRDQNIIPHNEIK